MKGLIGGKPAPPGYMRGVLARAKRLRKAVQPKRGRWQLVLPGFFANEMSPWRNWQTRQEAILWATENRKIAVKSRLRAGSNPAGDI